MKDAWHYEITKIGGLRVQHSRPLSDIYSDNTGRNSTAEVIASLGFHLNTTDKARGQRVSVCGSWFI